MFLDRLDRAANDSRLLANPYLSRLLHTLDQWGRPETLAKCVRSLQNNDKLLVNLVISATNRTESFFGYEKKVESYIDLSTLSKLVDTSIVEHRLRSLSRSAQFESLPKPSREAVQLFLDTYDGKVQGPERF